MAYEDDEHMEVVRHHNRVQRRVNSALRRALRYTVEYNDNLFKELCNSEYLAKEALERICIEGNLDCEPDDYENIIFECLKALQESRAK
jgi:hypothetical protein